MRRVLRLHGQASGVTTAAQPARHPPGPSSRRRGSYRLPFGQDHGGVLIVAVRSSRASQAVAIVVGVWQRAAGFSWVLEALAWAVSGGGRTGPSYEAGDACQASGYESPSHDCVSWWMGGARVSEARRVPCWKTADSPGFRLCGEAAVPARDELAQLGWRRSGSGVLTRMGVHRDDVFQSVAPPRAPVLAPRSGG